MKQVFLLYSELRTNSVLVATEINFKNKTKILIMKKVLGVLVLCLILVVNVNANDTKQITKKQEYKKTYGLVWTQTSRCGITYEVTWYCLSCLQGDFWYNYNAVQEEIDSYCDFPINPATGFPY